MQKIRLIPAVKEYRYDLTKVNFNKINYEEELSLFENDLLNKFKDINLTNNLKFICNEKLNEEAYIIDVLVDSIIVSYTNHNSKHNAILTLNQLLANISELTICHIYDEPDFKIRSIMIDIARNKVPSLNTLKNIVDEIALVKINELQLYIEGRAFYFESYPEFYKNEDDFLTGLDVTELKKYCNERNIDLIPNLNCFGHMGYWVNQERFSHLKLEEKFYWDENGLYGYSTSINPDNEESYELLFNLFDDLLKYYPDVNRITIGGDEPFELLFPKKREDADEIYQKHIARVVDYINSKGLTPWMWGDVVKLYPELLTKLDAKFLEWGYEAGQFNDENCSFYKLNNKDFIACCGTSCCNNISGRMDNMMINYRETAYFGKKYGACGMMITDWNDGGAYSQIPTNLLCYVYGACYAWNLEGVNDIEINKYLDNNVYKTKLANSVIELGRYVNYQDDPKVTFTKLFTMLYTHQMDGINYDIKSYSDCTALFNLNEVLNYNECIKTEAFLNKWLEEFNNVSDNYYCKEVMFTYKLLRHALDANKAYLRLRNIDCDIETIEKLVSDINRIIAEYDSIWHYRNKESDFYYSLRRLKMLRYRYSHILTLMKGEF